MQGIDNGTFQLSGSKSEKYIIYLDFLSIKYFIIFL